MPPDERLQKGSDAMNTAFLYPVLVQVALTFALVIATGLTRTAAIRRSAARQITSRTRSAISCGSVLGRKWLR